MSQGEGARLGRKVFSAVDDALERILAVQESIAAVTAHATSADGLVKITVNASGVVIDTAIRPQAFRAANPEELAATITKTTQQAAADAATQVNRLSGQLVDGRSEAPAAVDDPALATAERWSELTRFPEIPTEAPSSESEEEEFPEHRRGYMIRP